MSGNGNCPACNGKNIVQDQDGRWRCLDCGYKWDEKPIAEDEEETWEGDCKDNSEEEWDENKDDEETEEEEDLWEF